MKSHLVIVDSSYRMNEEARVKPKKKQGSHTKWTPTLPKTNVSPENGPSQKETSLPTIDFQGLCLVSGRVLVINGVMTLHGWPKING